MSNPDRDAQTFATLTIANYGAASALARARRMRWDHPKGRIPQWLLRAIELLAEAEAQRICDKWVERIGWGFHPDTRGADYDPPFSADEVTDYNKDMNTLFSLDGDPYEFAVQAMERSAGPQETTGESR
jgi:hypothetical protein